MKRDLLGKKSKKPSVTISSHDYFNLIPMEILSEIFCHVGYKTLVIVSSVCKTWRQVALSDPVWQSITNRYSIHFPFGLNFPERKLSSLKIIHDFFLELRQQSHLLGVVGLKYLDEEQLEPLLKDTGFILELVQKVQQTDDEAMTDLLQALLKNKKYYSEVFQTIASVLGETEAIKASQFFLLDPRGGK